MGFETHACSNPAAMVMTWDSLACILPTEYVPLTTGTGSDESTIKPFAVVAVIADRIMTPKETILISLALADTKAVPPTSNHAAALVHVVMGGPPEGTATP